MSITAKPVTNHASPLERVRNRRKTLKPLLNIGLWRYGPSRPENFVKANRDLEHKLRELGGMKWLYAQPYYTEEEFWKMDDKEWHDGLCQKTWRDVPT